MKKVLYLLLVVTAAAVGCHHARNDSTAATTVEREFMQRWVDQRTHDYMAQGKFANEAEARNQATQDFRQQYSYTTIASPLK